MEGGGWLGHLWVVSLGKKALCLFCSRVLLLLGYLSCLSGT